MQDGSLHLKDQLLVLDAQAGCTEAMEKLVGRFQKPLWLHAVGLTGDQQAAWDITQETWCDIIKGLMKLRDPANFKAWAYRITTNKSINWIRAKNRSRGVRTESLDSIADPPAKVSMQTGIKELMDQLTEAKKDVVSLYYFQRLTVGEISQALNIPQGTVKSRLHKARKELKKLWQEYIEM